MMSLEGLIKLIQVNFQEINPVSFVWGRSSILFLNVAFGKSHKNHFNKNILMGGMVLSEKHCVPCLPFKTSPRAKHRKEEHACLQLQFHPIVLEIEQLEVSETSLPKQPIG